jgi:hypothetical protein
MKITNVDFHYTGNIIQGQATVFVAQLITDGQGIDPILDDEYLKKYRADYTFVWSVGGTQSDIQPDPNEGWKASWVPKLPGDYLIDLIVTKVTGAKVPGLAQGAGETSRTVTVQPAPDAAKDPVTVRLESAVSALTDDDVLFQSIRESSASLNFSKYQTFVDQVMCEGTFLDDDVLGTKRNLFKRVNKHRATVFPGVDAYQKLKVATEVYLMLSVHVLGDHNQKQRGKTRVWFRISDPTQIRTSMEKA